MVEDNTRMIDTTGLAGPPPDPAERAAVTGRRERSRVVARTAPPSLPRFEARVVQERRPSHDLVLLRLELRPSVAYDFKAGQFTYVYAKTRSGDRRRAYSIASSPDDRGYIDLCVKMVNPEGTSGWLYDRERGDKVTISRAVGGFTFQTPPEVPVAFLATGTGVAPFRSMIDQLLGQGDQRPLWLFLGSGKPADLPYHDEFQRLAEHHSSFHYVPTLSRAGTFEWDGAHGWIQEAFLHHFSDQVGYEAYVCGIKVMVDDVRRLLQGQGLTEKQIHLERYV